MTTREEMRRIADKLEAAGSYDSARIARDIANRKPSLLTRVRAFFARRADSNGNSKGRGGGAAGGPGGGEEAA